MGLPPIPLPSEIVTVGGMEISVHGLSVAQMRRLQTLSETDTEAAGVQALAWGMDSTCEDVTEWLEASSPQHGLEVAEHVMRLSGHTELAAARFQAGLHEGRRGSEPVPPGRPDEQAPPGDP